MIPRTALVELGKLVAQALSRGQLSEALQAMGDPLSDDPKAMLTLLDLVARERAKKRPDTHLISAYALLLGQGLEALRYGIERAHPEAQSAVTALKDRVRALARDGKLDPGTLLLVLQQFASARLELEEDLQGLLGEVLDEAPPPADGPADIANFLEEVAKQLDNDAFAIQGQLAEQAAAVPESYRLGMAAALLGAGEPCLREAALGWLLDASASTRQGTLELLEEANAQGAVSGTMLRRLITVRPWLPETERPALDALVKACRLKGVECAPLPTAKVVEVTASGIDGAGAQSLFIVAKQGRRHAMASLLLKQGLGVRDAWVSRGMTKAQVEDMLDQIDAQVDLFNSSLDYLRLALGHALAINAESGALPPFGLVDVLETLGLADVHPKALSVSALLDRLMADIPADMRDADSVEEACEASADWAEDYDFPHSWFEDGGDLDGLLGTGRLSEKKRLSLVLERYLPQRRVHWAEMLGWTALMLRFAPEDTPEDATEEGSGWIDFTLVAREVAGDRPLAEIPVMVMIAATTVEAWSMRRG